MQSCFQIFFETRLTDLLRKTAESMLVDMVQLLFARMPQFKEEFKYSTVKKVNFKC
jgi:golgi-specific brefeldin A-resistance guanine nucleotide exchange factor 1